MSSTDPLDNRSDINPRVDASEAGVDIDVVVVIGVGGLGLAAARRLGAGRRLVLADLPGDALDSAVNTLSSSGYQLTVSPTDVSDPAAVSSLASAAARQGPIRTIVHTAGISPLQGEPADIFRVNLFGTALVLDAFLPTARSGTVIVCIASMGGYRVAVSAETERLLALTPTARLLELDALEPSKFTGADAYGVAKRGNQVRVEAQANRWAVRGARAVSVSPGIVVTPQSSRELAGPNGERMRAVLARAGTRVGTPDDIAAVVDFLAGPAGSFINGTDLLADGGVIANERWSDPTGRSSYFSSRTPA